MTCESSWRRKWQAKCWRLFLRGDMLFVSASGWEDGLPFVRDMASKDWESRYALSQCVLARREGKWVPYDSN